MKWCNDNVLTPTIIGLSDFFVTIHSILRDIIDMCTVYIIFLILIRIYSGHWRAEQIVECHNSVVHGSILEHEH